MGMISMATEINKILYEATCNFEECMTLLTGPKPEKASEPKKSPSCIMDDLRLIVEKSINLAELSGRMKGLLNGDDVPIPEGSNDFRH